MGGMRTLLVLIAVGLCIPLAGYAGTGGYEARDLPLGMGAARPSRIEPVFGRIASALASKRGEVRCWSPNDWGRINGEFLTHGDGTENLNDVAGFYRPDTSRIHLAPIACAGLVALRYRHEHPTGGKLEGEVALAVDTLAHE